MLRCPVCELDVLATKPYETWPPPAGLELAPPYRFQLGAPSYEVCAACGFEFGSDDEPWAEEVGASFDEWRSKWVAKGRRWFDERAWLEHEERRRIQSLEIVPDAAKALAPLPRAPES